MRGLRIEPEIELVARTGREFRIVGLRVQAAAHDDDAPRALGEVRVDGDREGDVGERPRGVHRDLVGVGMHLADQEMRRILRNRGGMRFPLEERRGVPGPREGSGSALPARQGELLAPRPEPGHTAHQRPRQAGFLFGSHQGKHRSQRNRHVAAADQFQHAQGVPRLIIAPGVSRDHGDAEHLDLRGLQQHHHRHLVRTTRAGAVLIDQHQALAGRVGGGRRHHARGQCHRRKGEKLARSQGILLSAAGSASRGPRTPARRMAAASPPPVYGLQPSRRA